jgi:hypothetical protein
MNTTPPIAQSIKTYTTSANAPHNDRQTHQLLKSATQETTDVFFTLVWLAAITLVPPWFYWIWDSDRSSFLVTHDS